MVSTKKKNVLAPQNKHLDMTTKTGIHRIVNGLVPGLSAAW